MSLLFSWITEDSGWWFIQLSVNILVLTIIAILVYEFNLRIVRVEFKSEGLQESLKNVNMQIDHTNSSMRRVTDSFNNVVVDELEQAASRIKNRVEPVDTPDE